MDSAPETVVRIGGPADIVGLLPYRVGFHPCESVVVMCLDGPRKRTGLVARHDLPPPGEEQELAELMAWHVQRNGAAAIVVAVYTAAPDCDGELPRAGLVDAIRDESGVEVLDALLVRDGRWWSYVCRDPRCCPPTGTAIPAEPEGAVGLIAAEVAGEGRAVLPDRAALEASVRPATGSVDGDEREQAREQARARLGRAVECGGVEAVRAEVLGALRSAAARWAEGSRALAEADAAAIVLGLHDKSTRDHAAVLGLDVDREVYLPLLVELCRRAGHEDAAPICTVLAWVAHLHGDGALANVAVDRALRSDPDYLMAGLVQRALLAQIPPDTVRAMTADVRADLRR